MTGNASPPSSTTGNPSVANSNQTMEGKKAPTSLCCIPSKEPHSANTATTTSDTAAEHAQKAPTNLCCIPTTSLCCKPHGTNKATATTTSDTAAPKDSSRERAHLLHSAITKDLKQVTDVSKELMDYGNTATEVIKVAEKRLKDLGDLFKGSKGSPPEDSLGGSIKSTTEISPGESHGDSIKSSMEIPPEESDSIKSSMEIQPEESLGDLVPGSTESPPEDLVDADVEEDLLELRKKVMKLKLQMLAKYRPPHPDSNGNQRPNELANNRRDITSKNPAKLPNLCKTEVLESSSEFKDFKVLYDGLTAQQKVCLLCFSVFPEKAIIKKRFMFYWWIGEGFVAPVKLDSGKEQTAEDSAEEVFRQLMVKCFIEPFSEKRNLDYLANKCRMQPFVRAAVIILAKRAKLFEFDSEGNPSVDFFFSYRACLLAGKKLKGVEVTDELHSSFMLNLDKIHMLFNFNENILEFEKPEYFLRMTNINLLCLGRWQASPAHHIEVEDTKFLDNLKNMKYLKFLSLQGISQIMELPVSISMLSSLTILDLRACPNLEEIPQEIGLLTSLTHLDMSECYLLVKMPKQLSNLTELQVLKGFVVGDEKEKNTCTLEHLAEMQKLRKLSIYTGRKDFPTASEQRDLNRLRLLKKLKIEWGGGSQRKSEKTTSESAKQDADTQQQGNGATDSESNELVNAAGSQATPSSNTKRCNCFTSVMLSTTKQCNCFTPATRSKFLGRSRTLKAERDARDRVLPELPPLLEKLDLQGFPQTHAPPWLTASKLSKVKKLYIRGGTLREVGQFDLKAATPKWEVEILRLKFLNDLEMDWRELHELFPKLKYLEKVRCPKLTFFPCDEQGVWTEKQEQSK